MRMSRKTIGAAVITMLLAAPMALAQTQSQPTQPPKTMPNTGMMDQGGMSGMMGQGGMMDMMTQMNEMMESCNKMMQTMAPKDAPAAPPKT